jgi:DNA processing protein
VGSRRPTPYGLQVAESFGAKLADLAITVVSGMARGIDTAAHRGAVNRKGRTLAVLGSGLDRIYPRENKKLAEKIASRGAVISEFPFGSEPERHHFPIRNRIISGLSRGVVVVEAAQRSGSLITAAAALDDGREVFAVPGNITSPLSDGCNRLLCDGATPLIDAGQLVACITQEERNRLPRKESLNAQALATELDSSQSMVYHYLLNHEARQFDQMARSLSMQPPVLAGILLDLELKSLVRELPGKRYIRV